MGSKNCKESIHRCASQKKRKADFPEPHVGGFLPRMFTSHENPEDDLEMAMAHRAIADALAQLPGNQRNALSLAYFRGYSHSQIAEILDEPLGTVKTRIRSALQKLRKIMGDDKKGKTNLNPNPDKLRINN